MTEQHIITSFNRGLLVLTCILYILTDFEFSYRNSQEIQNVEGQLELLNKIILNTKKSQCTILTRVKLWSKLFL